MIGQEGMIAVWLHIIMSCPLLFKDFYGRGLCGCPTTAQTQKKAFLLKSLVRSHMLTVITWFVISFFTHCHDSMLLWMVATQLLKSLGWFLACCYVATRMFAWFLSGCSLALSQYCILSLYGKEQLGHSWKYLILNFSRRAKPAARE